ncbi:hypothetical protein D1007_24013 [Hordeum vulgare]|nr:hypothetical protein D1007_24013 [Hordeum vulgare]
MGLGGPVDLCCGYRRARWSLSTPAAWHRGGAGGRLGGGGLDPHRPVPVFGGGETVVSASLPADSVLAHLSSAVWSSRLLVVFHGRWVDGMAGAESLREADDGDACGHSHLLGGVVIVLPVLPRPEHEGKP